MYRKAPSQVSSAKPKKPLGHMVGGLLGFSMNAIADIRRIPYFMALIRG